MNKFKPGQILMSLYSGYLVRVLADNRKSSSFEGVIVGKVDIPSPTSKEKYLLGHISSGWWKEAFTLYKDHHLTKLKIL